MKRGFTIIEILVVMIIIALIAMALIPAIFAVRKTVLRGTVSTEIAQLSQALEEFKLKYGDYPPDFANSDRTEALAEVKRFIYKAWPRCAYLPIDFQGSTLPDCYTPAMALPFWLGGIYSTTEGYLGFSKDPTNPFNVGTDGKSLSDPAAREGKIFDFPASRTKVTTATTGTNYSFYVFWPKTPDTTTNLTSSTYVNRQMAGYIYFKSNNGYDNRLWYTTAGATTTSVGAMKDSSSNWLNKNSYQIRCCGMDGMWWAKTDTTSPTTSNNTRWGAAIGTTSDRNPENADDLSNAWEGELQYAK